MADSCHYFRHSAANEYIYFPKDKYCNKCKYIWKAVSEPLCIVKALGIGVHVCGSIGEVLCGGSGESLGTGGGFFGVSVAICAGVLVWGGIADTLVLTDITCCTGAGYLLVQASTMCVAYVVLNKRSIVRIIRPLADTVSRSYVESVSPLIIKEIALIVSNMLVEKNALHVVGYVAAKACTRREADIFDVRLTAFCLFISFYPWD
ncbi:uncharacterized protein EV154DRAFT_485626 [Mucor mucedo]|uniref:uncharacterized protein n=1 Tax=Mucor mucedo TaxID=29922 RepID=UPI00221E7973|nr:uncharacterized protein EV154DRAFT_485626 [Mucor mucedo]KAI7882297.1 hypothetical protein EV154DRAFT_485626 [Mucor mucedo]